MSEVAHHAPRDFWRPPVQQEADAPISPVMGESCEGCGSEFMVDARFCYVCGTQRVLKAAAAPADWTRYFEFQNIKQALGLPVASMIAFLAGLGCLLAAVAVGFIYSIQNFADFQAIQFWRMQWLLAAVAAFVAGILLKHSGSAKS